jgi:hypothetical protein
VSSGVDRSRLLPWRNAPHTGSFSPVARISFAGRLSQHQQDVIDYLWEENRALRQQLESGRLRLNDGAPKGSLGPSATRLHWTGGTGYLGGSLGSFSGLSELGYLGGNFGSFCGLSEL